MKKTYINVGKIRIPISAECVECGRFFNLFDDVDADEYVNGHDCEVPTVSELFAKQDEIRERTIDQIADLL